MISCIKLEITLNIFLQVTVFKLLSHRSKSTPRLSSVAAMTGSLWANFMLCPWEWKWKSLILSDSLLPHGLYSPWNSPGQNTGVGSPSLLQRIFPIHRSNPGLLYCRQILYQLSQQGNPRVGSLSILQQIFRTQESNRCLLHFRQILYQLSHKGSPRILGWIVTYSFSRVSSWPRNRTRVSCIAGRFFTNWTMREALYFSSVSTTTILYSIQYLSLQVLPLIWVFISWWLLCHIKLALNKCLCFSLLICLLSI